MKVKARISIHDEYMHLEIPDELFGDGYTEASDSQQVYDFITDKFFDYLMCGGDLSITDIEYDETSDD